MNLESQPYRQRLPYPCDLAVVLCCAAIGCGGAPEPVAELDAPETAASWASANADIEVHSQQLIQPVAEPNVLGVPFVHYQSAQGLFDDYQQIKGTGMQTDTLLGGQSVDGVADNFALLASTDLPAGLGEICPPSQVAADLYAAVGGDNRSQRIRCALDGTTALVAFGGTGYFVNDETSGAVRHRDRAKLRSGQTYRIGVDVTPTSAKSTAVVRAGLLELEPSGSQQWHELGEACSSPGPTARCQWSFTPSHTMQGRVVFLAALAEPWQQGAWGSAAVLLDRAELTGLDESDEPLSGFDASLTDKLVEMGTPAMRFPGGTTSQSYVWTDAIGDPLNRALGFPRLQAATSPDFAPQDNWVSPEPAGTDEFLQFCEAHDIEPLLVINEMLMEYGANEQLDEVRPGSNMTRNEAVSLAANWVRYCNEPLGPGASEWALRRRDNGHPDPYGVTYWEIGNEEFLFDGECGSFHSADKYVANFIELAKAMKAVDPSIELVATGAASWDQTGWNETVLSGLACAQEAGTYLMDQISFHKYGPWTNVADPPLEAYRALMADALNAAEEASALQAQVDDAAMACGRTDIKVAPSEYGTWAGMGYPDTSAHSTLSASLYNAGTWFSYLKGEDREGNPFRMDLGFRWAFIDNPASLSALGSPVIVSDWNETRGISAFILGLLLEQLRRPIKPITSIVQAHTTTTGDASGSYDVDYDFVGPAGTHHPVQLEQVPLVEVLAGRSADGSRVGLFVFNRSLETTYEELAVAISRRSSDHDFAWTAKQVTGGCFDVNYEQEIVSAQPIGAGQGGGNRLVLPNLPPCSLLAVDIDYAADGAQD